MRDVVPCVSSRLRYYLSQFQSTTRNQRLMICNYRELARRPFWDVVICSNSCAALVYSWIPFPSLPPLSSPISPPTLSEPGPDCQQSGELLVACQAWLGRILFILACSWPRFRVTVTRNGFSSGGLGTGDELKVVTIVVAHRATVVDFPPSLCTRQPHYRVHGLSYGTLTV